jgi:hypothetical protein
LSNLPQNFGVEKRICAWAIILLAIAAPVLGGSVELWACATLAIGAGALMLVFPARQSLGRIPNVLFIAVVLIASTAFLPATWFSSPYWKLELQ